MAVTTEVYPHINAVRVEKVVTFDGSTSLFIGATGATGIDANEWWVSTTPTAAGIALPAATKDIVIAADIIATVADADVDAGVIEFVVWYRPISDDGLLVAA